MQVAFSDAQNALTERTKTEKIYFSDSKRLGAVSSFYNLSSLRYKESATSYLEVLDTERNLFNYELGNFQSRANMMKSVVRIFSSLTGGWLDKSAYESYQPMNPLDEQPESE